jgi:hypothetical protein
MFKRLEIDQERELEALVIKDPDAVEDGLIYLCHQRHMNGKFIDVLGVDKDGVLVVIELKVGEDDEMLLQALEYYDYVFSNRDRLANEYEKKAKIVIQEDPRIILVASGFSDRLKRAARHFEPNVSLREYSYLKTKSGESGLYCKDVAFESESGYSPPASLDSVFAYINLPAVKTACEKVSADILRIGGDLEAVPRGTQEIKFKCKNRNVGGLWVARTFFHVWWWVNEENWDSVKLASVREWSGKKQKVLKAMTKSYRSFGGG